MIVYTVEVEHRPPLKHIQDAVIPPNSRSTRLGLDQAWRAKLRVIRS